VNPKKHSEFKEDIASELGIHQNVVNDFISYYYSQLRKELSNLSANHIYVQGLGTFSLKMNKLKKAISKNKSILGNLKKTTYNGMEKTHAVNIKLQKQEKAYQRMLDEIEEIKNFKQTKNGH
jgi:nucleoid DNA-binding protein